MQQADLEERGFEFPHGSVGRLFMGRGGDAFCVEASRSLRVTGAWDLELRYPGSRVEGRADSLEELDTFLRVLHRKNRINGVFFDE